MVPSARAADDFYFKFLTRNLVGTAANRTTLRMGLIDGEIPMNLARKKNFARKTLTRNVKHKPVARTAMILAAAIALGAASAPNALAAVHGGAHGGHAGHHGHARGPIMDYAPTPQAPVFNPSTPYTVPQSPEVPVSPASPGSVFGN